MGGGEHILDKRVSSEKTSDDFIKNLKLLYFMTGDFLVPKSTKTIYTWVETSPSPIQLTANWFEETKIQESASLHGCIFF